MENASGNVTSPLILKSTTRRPPDTETTRKEDARFEYGQRAGYPRDLVEILNDNLR